MKKSLLLIFMMLCTHLLAFNQNNILKPEEAFKATAVKDNNKIHTVIKLAPEMYIYDEQLKYTITNPKKISLDKLIKRPKPVNFHDFIVHRKGDVVVDIPLSVIKEQIGDVPFTLKINYQGCSEKGLCYQPLSKSFDFGPVAVKKEVEKKKPTWNVASKETKEEIKTKAIETPQAEVNEEDKIVNALKSGSIGTILALFFGFGLLLALTPCIFPMIPILSSIIVSQSGDGKKEMSVARGLFLSTVYVLAMSIAYTIAGVLAGLFGANIQTAMQNPWVISIFSLIFVALAFSMFGYYEIQLPRTLQNKISQKSDDAQSGGLLGVAIMGFLSALIVGPCVAPALAGALVYIGQTGDALLGGMALFTMSIGMGVPLLIIGAGAGKFMPKPGGWMTLVSQIFGVVMLAISIWMLSRIIPGSIALFLWSLLFIGSGLYAGAFEPLKEGISGAKKMIKVFAIMLSLIGVIMLIGSFSGATNPLNPLEKFGACTPIGRTQAKHDFKVVKTIEELENEIKNSNQKVMIDFSADWCTSCKELEHITFPDPTVASLMSQFKLLRVDVTKNTDTDKALLKKYNIFGPPAIIFYDKDANELKNFKTIGYKPPEEFFKTLKKVLEK